MCRSSEARVLAFELTHREEQGRPVVRLLSGFLAQGYCVPPGFKTDFASIPTVIRWLIPVFGRSCRAAVLHDWLCHIGVPKAERSRLFLAQMLADKVPAWQAQLQYLAVAAWPWSERD